MSTYPLYSMSLTYGTYVNIIHLHYILFSSPLSLTISHFLLNYFILFLFSLLLIYPSPHAPTHAVFFVFASAATEMFLHGSSDGRPRSAGSFLLPPRTRPPAPPALLLPQHARAAHAARIHLASLISSSLGRHPPQWRPVLRLVARTGAKVSVRRSGEKPYFLASPCAIGLSQRDFRSFARGAPRFWPAW